MIISVLLFGIGIGFLMGWCLHRDWYPSAQVFGLTFWVQGDSYRASRFLYAIRRELTSNGPLAEEIRNVRWER